MDLTTKIKLFALDKDNIAHALAMLQVGKTARHSPHEIMSRIIADVLLKFNKIEIPPHPRDNIYDKSPRASNKRNNENT